LKSKLTEDRWEVWVFVPKAPPSSPKGQKGGIALYRRKGIRKQKLKIRFQDLGAENLERATYPEGGGAEGVLGHVKRRSAGLPPPGCNPCWRNFCLLSLLQQSNCALGKKACKSHGRKRRKTNLRSSKWGGVGTSVGSELAIESSLPRKKEKKESPTGGKIYGSGVTGGPLREQPSRKKVLSVSGRQKTETRTKGKKEQVPKDRSRDSLEKT